MINKLIFARVEILAGLHGRFHEETNKDALRQIAVIDEKLERTMERQQTLITIMSKGYIEPAVFTQENNDLAAEADRLSAEKEQLVRTVSGSAQRTSSLEELLKYTFNAEMRNEFDGELVQRFLDHVTVHGQDEVTFHLKCGLNLRERLE